MLNPNQPGERPLDPDLLLQCCEGAAGVLVAVSGGPDSSALLLLLDEWRRRPGRPAVFAATVDHGLRADSGLEAQAVADWCGELGVPHSILVWEGPKPATRIQERAREARYALLSARALQLGASVLLTAHHADDQYETILFRLARGSGTAGLAGMAKQARRGALLHARPLLDLPKSALVAHCERLGRHYVSDPSNDDPRFARTRLRRAAAGLAELGIGPAAVARLARRAARTEAAVAVGYSQFLASAALSRSPGQLELDRRALESAPEEFLVRLAYEEGARLSGRPSPRLEQAEELAQSLGEALRRGERFRATLAGAMFTLDKTLELRQEGPRRAGTGRTCRDAAGHGSFSAGERSLVKGG